MFQRALRACPIVLMSFLNLSANDFEPIPAAVWAIKEGATGAVILESRIKFNVYSIEYLYRVRIYAEGGRAAAEVEDLPTSVYGLKGRTVYPDGRQVLFNDQKDFGERFLKVGRGKVKQRHLVAPGITSDCVMELRWSEKANGLFSGLPNRYEQGLYHQWVLSKPYPIQTLVVEMPKSFPLAFALRPGLGIAPVVTEASTFKRFTLSNIPELELPPYSIQPTFNPPALVIFYQPEDLAGVSRKGPEAYWEAACKTIYKDAFEEGLDKSAAFKSLAMELTTGLEGVPSKKAAELMARLDKRINNLTLATHAEKAGLSKGFLEKLNSKDLDKAAKTGRTDEVGMQLLFFHLLKAAGIAPKVGMVVDREFNFFDWNSLNPWQFNHRLIGVDDPQGGTAWFDPTFRYATPGVVHPDYTGVPALVVDSATWKPTRGSVASLSSGLNSRRYTYALKLDEEMDEFTLKTEFGGFPEFLERLRFMALEPSDQSKELKESLTKSMKSVTIDSAEVQNASDPSKGVLWEVKGRIERESQRKRTVDPFPSMPWPLEVPSKLEAKRTGPIILPFLSTHIAISTFKVPSGWTMGEQQTLKMQNGFGRVVWLPSYDPATREAKVVLRVDVSAMSAGAMEWGAFKAYLGWIEDACRRDVELTKE